VVAYTLEEIREFNDAATTIRQRRLTLARFLQQTELPARLATEPARDITRVAKMLREKLGPEAVASCEEGFRSALDALCNRTMAARLRKRTRLSVYLEDAWNYVDVVNLTCFWAAGAVHVIIAAEVSTLVERAAASDSNEFINAWPLTRVIMWYDYLQGINCFLCLYKLFKYLHGADSKMAQLIQTLSNASTDLFYFTAILFIVLVGFGAMFTCAFGNDVFEFRTLTISIMTLVRAVPEGVLFYEDLAAANRFMGPLAYICYNVLVFLVLMNMFLAIINSSYEEVRLKNLQDGGSGKVMTRRLGAFLFERRKQTIPVHRNAVASRNGADAP